jgi:hypothetical protein
LRIGDQRAISAFTKRLNFAGVRSLFGGIDPPSSVTFALTAQGFVERGRELVDNGLRGVLGPPRLLAPSKRNWIRCVTGVDHRILRLNAVRQGTWKKQQLTFGNGIVSHSLESW